jgi:hypothetical protein
MTAARWQREFVKSHPGYKKDSVVTQEIAHDLMKRCADIGEGRVNVPELLGDKVTCLNPSLGFEFFPEFSPPSTLQPPPSTLNTKHA